jgi:hypothetical protein
VTFSRSTVPATASQTFHRFAFSVIAVLIVTMPSWLRAEDAKSDGKADRVVKARSFVVRDAEGRERACLQFAPRGRTAPTHSSPALQLLAPDGRGRFEFGLDDLADAPYLWASRADGQTAIFMTSDKDGNVVAFEPRGKKQPAILMQTWHSPGEEGDGAAFEFYNPRGIPQVGLAVWPDDSPGMRLYDPEGRPFEPGNPPVAPVTASPASLSRMPTRPASQVDKQKAGQYPVLEADAYALLDDKDRVRAVFGLLGEGASRKGTALEFYDLGGTTRASVVFDEDSDRVSISFAGVKGSAAMHMQVSREGPFLKLFTSQQEKSILVSLGNPREGKPGASGVNLTAADGTPRVIFGERPRGGGMIGAADRTGERSLLEVH